MCLGVAFTYSDISGDLRRRVRDASRFDGTREALPDYEGVLELTYQVNLAPWLQISQIFSTLFILAAALTTTMLLCSGYARW